jgi:hypothetical protein
MKSSISIAMTLVVATDARGEQTAERPGNSNALDSVAGHCAMPLGVASVHHMGVMSSGIEMPVVGGVFR